MTDVPSQTNLRNFIEIVVPENVEAVCTLIMQHRNLIFREKVATIEISITRINKR